MQKQQIFFYKTIKDERCCIFLFLFFPPHQEKEVLSLFKMVIVKRGYVYMDLRVCIHYLLHWTTFLLVIATHCSIKLSTKDTYMQEVSKNYRILHRDCKKRFYDSVLQSSPCEQEVCCKDQSFYLVSAASI